MKKLLLLSLTLLSFTCVTLGAYAQVATLRGGGETNFEATQKSIELQLIVEEIEDAGFELDVVEGFEEEWEEEIWIDAASDEMDANYLDPNETERFDAVDVTLTTDATAEEEWDLETWENTEDVIAETDEFESLDDEAQIEDAVAMRGEEEELDVEIEESLNATFDFEEIETAELNWWDESDWQDVIDEMEMDLDNDFEGEEDLDLLEEIYEMG